MFLKCFYVKYQLFYVSMLICVAALLTSSGCSNHLIEAVNRNNLTEVRAILDKGADIDSRERSIGATALYQASFRGYVELVSFLLGRGADINLRTKEGFTALEAAAQQNHPEVVEMLIASGADVSSITESLQMPAQRGHQKVVEILISHGADVNARFKDGQTVIHSAAIGGNIEMAKKLIARGVDVNLRTRKLQWTPLHFAANKGNVDFARVLLEAGADINAKDTEGKSALHIAASNDDEKMFNFLIRSEAELYEIPFEFDMAMTNKLTGQYYEDQNKPSLAYKHFTLAYEAFDKLAEKYRKEYEAVSVEPSIGTRMLAFRLAYGDQVLADEMSDIMTYGIGQSRSAYVARWPETAQWYKSKAIKYRRLADFCQERISSLSKTSDEVD